MVDNKQINVWRGTDPPPTIYHVWIYGTTKMLLYNGTEWVTFIDDYATIEKIDGLIKDISTTISRVNTLEENTVNDISIKDNPVLTGENIVSKSEGNYLTSEQLVKDALTIIDTLLTTQIIQ